MHAGKTSKVNGTNSCNSNTLIFAKARIDFGVFEFYFNVRFAVLACIVRSTNDFRVRREAALLLLWNQANFLLSYYLKYLLIDKSARLSQHISAILSPHLGPQFISNVQNYWNYENCWNYEDLECVKSDIPLQMIYLRPKSWVLSHLVQSISLSLYTLCLALVSTSYCTRRSLYLWQKNMPYLVNQHLWQLCVYWGEYNCWTWGQHNNEDEQVQAPYHPLQWFFLINQTQIQLLTLSNLRAFPGSIIDWWRWTIQRNRAVPTRPINRIAMPWKTKKILKISND